MSFSSYTLGDLEIVPLEKKVNKIRKAANKILAFTPQ